MSDFATFVKPLLATNLAAVALDVEYVRGEGDFLFFRDAEGEEVEVLDLVGGFGASLFGHNHPELVARARAVLDAGRPNHVQGSVRATAGTLGRRLSQIGERATGRSFIAHFANSGPEAVEAAIKHDEMERRERVYAIIARLGEIQHDVRRRLREHSARLSESVFDQAARMFGLARIDGIDELFLRLYRRALDVLEQPPVFLAGEGAFHGKTSGSLKLTFRAEYHAPWRAIGPARTFSTIGDVAALDEVIDRTTLRFVELELGPDREYRLVERALVNVAACFVEPIQGEGGVKEVDVAYLRALREAADRHGFPLVLDEIQCGMGRTGRFFASEHAGVRGDYYLLSKALGGGLAKISALLIERSRYLEDFGFLHTSTFADDDFSSEVAIGTLDLVERDDGALMRRCSETGDYFLGRLRDLMARYPDQIQAVRGRGLMIGVEIASQEGSPSPMMRLVSDQEMLGFVVSGWLLREERIRVAPTLSARATIRLEPSAYVERANLDRFCAALARLAELLRRGDAHQLLRFVVGREGEPAPTRVPHHRNRPPRAPAEGAARVGFLTHFLSPGDLADWDPALLPFTPADCDRFLARSRSMVEPFVAARTALRSPTGSAVEATVFALPFTPAQVVDALRGGAGEWSVRLITQGIELARRAGCGVVGFGGFTSILTNNCRDVLASDIAVTSGNSLTAAAALEAAKLAGDRLGLGRRVLGVVGAAGNIGRVLAEVAADWVDEVVLVGRPGADRRLGEGAAQIAAAASRQGGQLARRIAADGAERAIRIATDMAALRGCNVVITASNAARPIILPEHLAADTAIVVSDVAVPRDVSPTVLRDRPLAVVLKGGVVRAPLGQTLEVDGMNLPPGEVYGCLAETMLMGLAGIGENFSYGSLDPQRVRRARTLALEHGFSLEENRLSLSDTELSNA
jgi:acetylornithine/succinyldiaminopimelate/putrescine aminotransferase/predicted amino acid dehydrogenase